VGAPRLPSTCRRCAAQRKQSTNTAESESKPCEPCSVVEAQVDTMEVGRSRALTGGEAANSEGRCSGSSASAARRRVPRTSSRVDCHSNDARSSSWDCTAVLDEASSGEADLDRAAFATGDEERATLGGTHWRDFEALCWGRYSLSECTTVAARTSRGSSLRRRVPVVVTDRPSGRKGTDGLPAGGGGR
jgi:hypothetical protein